MSKRIINGKYQMSVVEKLHFVRIAGSDEEKRAAELIVEEIRALGGEPIFESFTIPDAEISESVLRAVEPYEETIDAIGVRLSGSTPEEGITAELAYVEDASELALNKADVKGKIILCNDGALVNWKRIVASGAVGCLLMNGEYDGSVEETDIPYGILRPHHLEHGTIPALYIRTSAAMRLLRNKAEKVFIKLVQEEKEATSSNVIAEIKGSDRADEVVVLTAHYDSVPYSRGAWDNASGSADLLALYAYFSENKPRRTMRFIWCGAEERGLLGSKAYVAAHENELEKIVLGINLDMTGVLIGSDQSIVTGLEATKSLIEYMAREKGQVIDVRRDVHSSDSTVFADKGIPTVSFVRRGKGAYHSRRDKIESLHEDAFARLQEFMRFFIDRMVSAEYMPIPREIPDDMKESINKYFRR